MFHSDLCLISGSENQLNLQAYRQTCPSSSKLTICMPQASFLHGAHMDERGGHIVFSACGVSLSVPPDAIAPGDKKCVTFKILNTSETSNILNLRAGSSIVSPIVVCEPHGLKFNQSVILSHPISQHYSAKGYLPLVCNQEDTDTELIFNKADDDPSISFFIIGSRAYWIINHFTLFGVAAREKIPSELSVYPFSEVLHENSDAVLRVYVYQRNDLGQKMVSSFMVSKEVLD